MRGGRRVGAALLVIAVELGAALLGSGTADAWSGGKTECPVGLVCHFTPAVSSNYDTAERPSDGDGIRYIVIHDTEERYDAAIARFQDPRSHISAHYVIRSFDGQITQLVHTRDIAHHAGNYWFNMHSIGIEHEGILVEGARWYTEAMYQASARLVRYLAARYHIPLDRHHILSHEEMPGVTPDSVAGMHYDPGPYWDWAHYFDLLGARLPAAHIMTAPVVTIAPRFDTNVEPLQRCAGDSCTNLPPQGSNVVYLHTEPSSEAPLIGDPALHPDGSPGTTRVADWSAKALIGQSFVVAGRSGEWTAIWFGGRMVWFHDPPGEVSAPGHGPLITPRPGRSTIPVYGAAYPEAAAYPPTIPMTAVVPLQYTMSAGQIYVGVDRGFGDYYYAPSGDADVPDDHTLVVGNRRLVEISFNHRQAFVEADDVLILR
ncbi:MAG: N-acetylmuramoyl-L-alanine amidase [Pseudonocardiales bacterium]|nr:N-acetylmuramoyl-L-alanine amidase [Pseudonocardiales bacterium]MBV9729734.1 N-acetylmuramoyl-L-alanine amidase [Pseudonocardiales bacterium]